MAEATTPARSDPYLDPYPRPLLLDPDVDDAALRPDDRPGPPEGSVPTHDRFAPPPRGLFEPAPAPQPPAAGRRHRAGDTGPAGSSLVSRRGALLAAAGTGLVAAGGAAKVLSPAADTLRGVTLITPNAASVTMSRTAAAAQAAATAGTTGTATAAGSTSTAAAFKLPKGLSHELLIRRVTYGATPAVRAAVERLGPTAWLEQQLHPATIKDPGGAAVARLFPRLRWSTAKVRSSLPSGGWEVMVDLVAAHVGRAIWSKRQLFEVMVDFWSNHLNVTCPSSDVWDTRHRYDAVVIRKHALGKFADMLQASAAHPSMLLYLNNAESTGQDPNENYARELMELHTVGVDGGYDETDVKQAALLLTGMTVQDGKAVYVPGRHHVGRVSVMGFTRANASAAKGRAVQKAFVSYLAHHPKTARTIAHKLAVRFVSDAPPAALVTRLAKVYRKHDTAVLPVLKALFASPEFAESAGEKVRRPFEVTVATARAIGVTRGKNPRDGLKALFWDLQASGHTPLGWPPPDGYADVARAWQSPAAALDRFNATSNIVHGWWPSQLGLPGPEKLVKSPPTTRAGVITAVSKKVLGHAPTVAQREAATALLASTDLPASFAAGSYQQRETIALTAVLLLNSPAHLKR